jgi:ankyrin repeat protein
VDDGNLGKIRDILLTIDDLSIIHDYDFRTPLHIAAARDRGEIAQFLINRGAKINSLDRWRRTPLYEAVANKSKKVAKILAQHQGNFSLSGMELSVFLNRIIMTGDLYMLQLALLSGANVNC